MFRQAFTSPKAGRKKELATSAVYPRDFGLAVAGLLGRRWPPVGKVDKINLAYDFMDDDLRALDDLLIGPNRTWWRKL